MHREEGLEKVEGLEEKTEPGHGYSWDHGGETSVCFRREGKVRESIEGKLNSFQI